MENDVTGGSKPERISKTTFLRHASPISKVNLLVFSLIFAVIGGYAIYRSFAASPLGSSLPARLPLSSGSGGTYYVSPSGSDSGSGSQSAPWQTINHALNNVPLSGSIIKVEPGTYQSDAANSNYAVTFSRQGDINDPVTLEAVTPGTVNITSNSTSIATFGSWIINATGLRIQGLTFHVVNDPSYETGYQPVLIENSSNIEVTGCTFNETAGQGIVVRGGNPGTASDDWIYGNTFRPSGTNPYAQVTGTGYTSDNSYGALGSHWIYAGQYGDSSSSGYTSGSRRLVVANNVFVGTTAGYDVQLGPQAIEDYVVNNTFFGNHAISVIGASTFARYAASGVILYSDGSGSAYVTNSALVINNIFDDLDGHSLQVSGPTMVNNLVQNNLSFNTRNGEGYSGNQSADYDAYYGTAGPSFSIGTGNLADADPLFVNPTSYNYNLQSGSPAIGRSDPAYTPLTDITGAARSATSPSLGAYEANAGSGDTTPPTVSLTAPANNATVSGSSVALAANASDNVAVASVEFDEDTGGHGGLIKTITSAPYTATWDTTGVANGTYNLTAIAKDTSGNTSSSTVVVTVSNPVGSSINIGEINVLPTSDTNNGNLLVAQSANLSQAATIKSLSFYVTTASGNLRLGIYDSTGPGGGPGALLAVTSELTPSVGWNTSSVTTPVLLQPGTYWLAYLPSSSSLAFVKTADSTSSGVDYAYTYGALPTTFSTTPNTTASHWSLYATLTPSSATKPGDLNKDGVVNNADLTILINDWGTNNATADINGDGVVNILDLSILLTNFGQ